MFPLRHVDSSSWVTSVRQRCVYGGARTNAFGAIWEKFIADSLEEYGWEILARGLKLKKHGRMLTDIDILGFRDGLTLVIQVKAFARSGMNVYEQWLSRSAIIQGAEQAICACSELNVNPTILGSKRTSPGADQIQPLVVTNSPIFSGWRVNNVPVIGDGELMSILRGGKIKYTAGHSVVHEGSVYDGETLSRQEFVSLLHEPVGFRIAQWSRHVEHFCAGRGPIDLRFPCNTDGEDIVARHMGVVGK